jgi:hypothetical protein
VPFNILNVHIDYENSKQIGVETLIEESSHTFFIEKLSLFQRLSIPPSMHVNPLG